MLHALTHLKPTSQLIIIWFIHMMPLISWNPLQLPSQGSEGKIKHSTTWDSSIPHADDRSFTSSTAICRNNLLFYYSDEWLLISVSHPLKARPYTMSRFHWEEAFWQADGERGVLIWQWGVHELQWNMSRAQTFVCRTQCACKSGCAAQGIGILMLCSIICDPVDFDLIIVLVFSVLVVFIFLCWLVFMAAILSLFIELSADYILSDHFILFLWHIWTLPQLLSWGQTSQSALWSEWFTIVSASASLTYCHSLFF